jgi:3-hydroxyisobutyrate dehydrogenase-like beta-hydroxyacid dehydrogenase
MMDVGFIGLGDQGGPMAEAIAGQGHRLHVWARRPETLLPFVARGAVAHDDPVALARAVDHLGLCVLAESDVEELLRDRGLLAALRPGALIAVHTTMTPAACRDLAAEAARHGIDFVDAPVSGGREGAVNRRLLVFVGAEAAALERARPIFSCYAGEIRYMGPVGTAQTAKILNNLLLNANLAAAHAVLDFGEALGIARSDLREALLRGTASSVALDWLDRLIIPGRHPATLGRKDIALALALASDTTPLPAAIAALAQSALAGRELLARPEEYLQAHTGQSGL